MSGRLNGEWVRNAFDLALAMMVLVVADGLVRLLPFGIIARRIERGLRHAAPESSLGFRAGRVRWAIAAAQRRVPWNIPCLATAVAANRLLAWRGVPSELWFGVRASGDTAVDAHAWLVAAGRVVAGTTAKRDYEPLRGLITSAPQLG